jgi:phospholipid transport system substrate-binding protein
VFPSFHGEPGERAVRSRRWLLSLAFACGVAAAGFAAPAARAAAEGSSSRFIERLGQDAISVLSNEALSRDARLDEFRRLLREGFALDAIGRFVLGRHWQSASPEQRQAFLAAFEDFVVNSYAARLGQYSGETFKVLDERADGERGHAVDTQIVRPSAPPIMVQWRVREADSGPKIVDIVIEGVSLAITQRSEFAAVIQQNGGRIDPLIEQLRQKSKAAAR